MFFFKRKPSRTIIALQEAIASLEQSREFSAQIMKDNADRIGRAMDRVVRLESREKREALRDGRTDRIPGKLNFDDNPFFPPDTSKFNFRCVMPKSADVKGQTEESADQPESLSMPAEPGVGFLTPDSVIINGTKVEISGVVSIEPVNKTGDVSVGFLYKPAPAAQPKGPAVNEMLKNASDRVAYEKLLSTHPEPEPLVGYVEKNAKGERVYMGNGRWVERGIHNFAHNDFAQAHDHSERIRERATPKGDGVPMGFVSLDKDNVRPPLPSSVDAAVYKAENTSKGPERYADRMAVVGRQKNALSVYLRDAAYTDDANTEKNRLDMAIRQADAIAAGLRTFAESRKSK